MNKKDMLQALIDFYCDGNKTRFAKKIGITPQGVSTWLNRNMFDLELIYSKCENLSAHWLLTGDGEMIQNSQNENKHFANECNVVNSDLLELCKILVANYQQRDDVMNKLVSMINN